MPASADDEVMQVKLFKRRLEDARDSKSQDFIPLSYTWGDASRQETIMVNGMSKPVTTNLAKMLRDVRKTVLPVIDTLKFYNGKPLFWADAICINQNDIEERNHQVGLMRSIYGSATLVIAWIGVSENSHITANLINVIAQEWQAKIPQSERWEEFTIHPNHGNWMESYPQFWRKDCEEITKNIYWNSVHNLLRSPFWKRMWTFQEVVLPTYPLCLCGSSLIQLEHLVGVRTWLNQMEGQSMSHFQFVDSEILKSMKSGTFLELHDLIRIRYGRSMHFQVQLRHDLSLVAFGRYLLAFDPRDKIFALLGLIKTELVADYSKSTRDIYCKLVSTWCSEVGNLELLNYSGSNRRFKDWSQLELELPSWVPNWQTTTLQRELIGILGGRMFNASKGLSMSPICFSESLNILYIPGIQCEEIDQVLLPWSPDVLFTSLREFAIRNSQITNERSSGTKMHIIQLLFRTALVDRYYNHNRRLNLSTEETHSMVLNFLFLLLCPLVEMPEYGWTKVLEIYLPLLGLGSGPQFASHYKDMVFPNADTIPQLQQWSDAKSAFRLELQGEMTNRLYVTIRKFLSPMSMFTTKCGYIGISERISPGDIVVALAGCTIPKILRKIGSHYEQVGSCFILGYMDGEAMEKVMRGEASIQTFEIH